MTSLLGQSGTSHTNTVTALAFSPDGKTLVSAARDGTIRFWSVETQKQVRVIPLELPKNIGKLLVLDDSHSIAFTDADRGLMTWSESKGIECLIDQREVRAIVLCDSGHYIVERGRYSFFFGRIGQGRATERYLGNYSSLNGAASNKDGSLVALWTCEYLIMIDIESGRHRWRMSFPEWASKEAFLVFTSDSSRLALGPWKGSNYIIDIVSGHFVEASNFDSFEDRDLFACFGPMDQVLITTGPSRQIRIWDASSLNLVSMLWDDDDVKAESGGDDTSLRDMIAHSRDVSSLAITGNQSMIATGGDDCLIKLWDLEHRKLIARFGSKRNEVRILIFADEEHVISGHTDGTICLWSLSQSKVLVRLNNHSSWIRNLFLQSERLISFETSDVIRVWKYPSLEFESEIKVDDDTNLCSVAASKDSPIVVIAGNHYEREWSDYLTFWNLDSNREAVRWDLNQVLDCQEGRETGYWAEIAVSADGSYVAIGSASDVWILDSQTAQIRGHHQTELAGSNERNVSELVFSNDGKFLAIRTCSKYQWLAWVSRGSYIHFVDTSNARMLGSLKYLEPTSTVCFSPDNKRILSAMNNDHQIFVNAFDLQNPRNPLLGHTGTVRCIDFCPDGSMFASGGDDGVIVIWKDDQIFKSLSLDDSSGCPTSRDR